MMFWVEDVHRWVCQDCAIQAHLGQDLTTDFVRIRQVDRHGEGAVEVPRWWAEREGREWIETGFYPIPSPKPAVAPKPAAASAPPKSDMKLMMADMAKKFEQGAGSVGGEMQQGKLF